MDFKEPQISSPVNRKANCEAAWESALEQCRQILGEEDFLLVTSFKDADQLKDAVQQLEVRYHDSWVSRLLKRFHPQLERLKDSFILLSCLLASTNISLVVTWGAVSLLIQLACESEKALREITNMLGDISRSLKLFEIYAENRTLEPDMVQLLFDVIVDLVLCSTKAIKHFRKNDVESATVVLSWKNVCKGFTDSLDDIKAKVEYLKNVAEAKNISKIEKVDSDQAYILEQLRTLQTELRRSPREEGLMLPCHTLPFQRNPHFYGRADILSTISSALEHEENGRDKIHSIALWGAGGIGKSQIALEYANFQIAAGLPIVLWVACEQETAILKSFNDAARHMNVPGYSRSNGPDQNRSAVLRFLQQTCHPWLIVFDNVEDSNLLQQNWPKATTGNGSIIVTCRSEITAASPAADSLEVPTFNVEEGSELFLRFLAKKSPTENDIAVARELSNRLGGLALGLELMAKQARVRKKPLDQFLNFYNEHRRSLDKTPKRGIHNPYYDKDLETAWKAAFDNLSGPASAMMSLLCFVAPDAIPQTLFDIRCEGVAKSTFIGDFGFLEDADQFNDAILELLDQSLIKVNAETSLMSVHRLIRTAAWDRSGDLTRTLSFQTMTDLFNCHFPRRNTAGHMWDNHQVCQKLVQHVQAYKDRYVEMKNGGSLNEVYDMTALMCSASWYLFEACLLEDSQSMLDAALKNCNDTTSTDYAMIIDGSGALATEFAHYSRANDCFEQLLKIAKLKPEATELYLRQSYAYSALAYILPGLWRTDDAIRMGEKALTYFEGLSIDEAKQFHPDRLCRNCGRAYFCAGDLDKAQQYFESAVQWAKDIFGPDSYYHGEACYSLGRIAARRQKYDEARKFFEDAYVLLGRANPTSSAVAAVLFQQGRLAMDINDSEEALDKYMRSLTICKANAVKGNKGEMARVLWYISKAMETRKMHEAASDFRKEAITIRDAMYGTGLFAWPIDECEENIWDGLVGILYR